VNHTHDGLSLWYGTDDAAAPDLDALVPRRGVSLVIGVHPANPTNSVVVRYRVNRGVVRTLPGRELRTDSERQTQYFTILFPDLPTGHLVEYSPVLTCGGRQVPAPAVADAFPSRFRLGAAEAAPARSEPRGALPRDVRFVPRLEFVASVSLQFDTLEFVGDTPFGMRVNFPVREGTVEGPGFSARVLPGSADHMIVRQDGMGVVRIRGVFATADGAQLDVEAGGYVDFGPDGYRSAMAHRLPDRSPLVLSPLVFTRHPKYRWLNRVQCVGSGYTRLDAGQAGYDVYTALPRDIPVTR
jgi:uncharacterized protein DUF3237